MFKPIVAILIVHGGNGPSAGKWIHICLKNIHKYTKRPPYKIYLWNNSPEDTSIDEILKAYRGIKIIKAKPGEKLKHPHAVPLQRLYEIALKDNVKYIVTMDTDAFPVKNDWLRYLIRQLDDQTVLAGNWRDELKKEIEPYIHPSCLCTTVEFIEKYQLRFENVDISPGKKIDTLSCFTRSALENNYKLFKLQRSNKNQFHYLMGGLYGDLIYHHGAGSRKDIFFWGEEKSEALSLKNKTINLSLQHLVFYYESRYIDWMMGNLQEKNNIKNGCDEFASKIAELEKISTEMNHE